VFKIFTKVKCVAIVELVGERYQMIRLDYYNKKRGDATFIL